MIVHGHHHESYAARLANGIDELSDVPKTWDAFWDFFKPMQKELRAKGSRKLFAFGLQITTVGPNDGNGLFQAFMIANGGNDIVTPDGKRHADDPKVRDVAIRSCSYLTNAYEQGYIPPEAPSWNNADDSNAFHDDGKPIPARVGAGGGYTPVGAKNVDVAKDR